MMRLIEVRDPSQVAEARRAAVSLARTQGFSEEDAGRVAIAASELSTNLIKHGCGGTVLLGTFEEPASAGVEILALDRGPGMNDVSVSSRDGYSTAGTAGTGLGAVLRSAQSTDIFSAPGLGTAVLARLSPKSRSQTKQAESSKSGSISVAMAGEEACGDAWATRSLGSGAALMVADGLGHGPQAAEASLAAVKEFLKAANPRCSVVMASMHAALKRTRGAAVAVSTIDNEANEIVFCGVGNVAATIIGQDGGVRRMVSHNGTVGHVARTIRDFSYPIEDAALVILASDGLGTSWRLEDYPGLALRHPTLIAGVLYRDFNRGRDDVTVLVAKLRPS